VGSVYYGLAHDTLVKPILADRDSRIAARSRTRRRSAFVLVAAIALALLGGFLATRDQSNGPRELDVGVLVHGAITSDEAEPVYEFESEGQLAVVMAVPDSNLDAVLELTDPSGNTTEINRGGVGEFEFEVAPSGTAGRYRVGVQGADASASSFALSVNSADIFRIGVGDRVGGSLARRGDVDLYELGGTSGDSSLISVSPDAEFDVVLAVTKPDGTSSVVDAGKAGETEIAFTDPADPGTYRIALWGYEDNSRTYSIAVTPPSSLPLAAGTMTGMAGGDELSLFEFQSRPDGASEVIVTPDETLDVALTLMGEDGLARFDTGESGQVEFAVTDIGFDGPYRMVVSAAAASTGTFRVEVKPLDVVTSGLSEGVEGDVQGRGDVDVFEFEVPAGRTSRITVAPDAQFDVVFEVTGPDGGVTVNDGVEGEAERYSATFTGGPARFRVVVRGFQARTGTYTITVEEEATG
jgi:hypothetical protein